MKTTVSVGFGVVPMTNEILAGVYEQIAPLKRRLLSGNTLTPKEKARLDYLQWHVNRARLAQVKSASVATGSSMRERMHLREQVASLVESLKAVPGAFGRRSR